MLHQSALPQTQPDPIDRQAIELQIAELRIQRRAAQIAANERAAGLTPPANWVGLDAALAWPICPSSCAIPPPAPPMPAAASQPTNSPPSCGCAQCDGAGYYKLAVPVDHPQFGRLQPCDCTLAWRAQRDTERLQALDAQLLRYRECRLASFDLQRPIAGPLQWDGYAFDIAQQRQALAEAYRIASAWVERPHGWLYLYGPPGSGKTRLAASIANELRDRGILATYGRIQALLDWLKRGFHTSEAHDFDQRLHALERAPLLLIDDLGTEHGTAWERTILENLLNERYNRELPTVLTSNAWRDALPARIADRIAEHAQVIWLMVSSYRCEQRAAPQCVDVWDRGEGEYT